MKDEGTLEVITRYYNNGVSTHSVDGGKTFWPTLPIALGELVRSKEHSHDWLIVKDNVRYREEDGTEFIIDFYRCECGAGGRVKTPKAEYDKGNKVLGITEDKED